MSGSTAAVRTTPSAWTQCYVSIGDPDGEDFAFTKCDADGTFTISGIPAGNWRVTTFDQWNDQLVDGLSTRSRATGVTPPSIWGHRQPRSGRPTSTPAPSSTTTRTASRTTDDRRNSAAQRRVRLRDGSLENLLVTDFTGTANFNETFPLFSWYVVETDYHALQEHRHARGVRRAAVRPTARRLHAGPAVSGLYPPCGTLRPSASHLANTEERSRCRPTWRCRDRSTARPRIARSVDPERSVTTRLPNQRVTLAQRSTGRIDPPWVGVEGWQGFPGQSNFVEFGKEPYVAGENGGIKGHVVYASTRPFDDPQLLVQTQWEPLVPHVTINLYKRALRPTDVTPTLTLVDTTADQQLGRLGAGLPLRTAIKTMVPT